MCVLKHACVPEDSCLLPSNSGSGRHFPLCSVSRHFATRYVTRNGATVNVNFVLLEVFVHGTVRCHVLPSPAFCEQLFLAGWTEQRPIARACRRCSQERAQLLWRRQHRLVSSSKTLFLMHLSCCCPKTRFIPI